MIGRLSGQVDWLGEDRVIIDVGGVGYLVFCSGRTLSQMPSVGEAVRLHIETHVREDHIHLYGFLETAEQDWFTLLQSVQGVGVRSALAILSVLGPGDLVNAVMAQDKAMLTRAPGVGPKVAGRIVTELKDKVAKIAISEAAASHMANRAAGGAGSQAAAGGEAVSALVNLGYRQNEAMSAVQTVLKDLGGEAKVEELIRGSLRELAP